MGRLILVLGGARSGKSVFAESLAGLERKVAYIATARPADDEMRERVRAHRARRSKQWVTYEQPEEIHTRLHAASDDFDAVLVDCVLVYVSNMLLADETQRQSNAGILAAIDRLVRAAKVSKADVVVVSGEVGSGIIPANELARRYADLMGLANQKLAAGADEVYLVTAGIPQRLKPCEEPS